MQIAVSAAIDRVKKLSYSQGLSLSGGGQPATCLARHNFKPDQKFEARDLRSSTRPAAEPDSHADLQTGPESCTTCCRSCSRPRTRPDRNRLVPVLSWLVRRERPSQSRQRRCEAPPTVGGAWRSIPGPPELPGTGTTPRSSRESCVRRGHALVVESRRSSNMMIDIRVGRSDTNVIHPLERDLTMSAHPNSPSMPTSTQTKQSKPSEFRRPLARCHPTPVGVTMHGWR